jgi:hypothetical protein
MSSLLPQFSLAVLSLPEIPRLSEDFMIVNSGLSCSVVSSKLALLQDGACQSRLHQFPCSRRDSECDSVHDVVDSHQSNTVSQEIMSSSFVMNMFALPDSDDEFDGPPYAVSNAASVPQDIGSMSPVDILECIVDGSLGLGLPASYWLSHDASGVLGIERHTHSDFSPRQPVTSPSHDLNTTGYTVYESQAAFARDVCPSLVNAIKSLVAAGWPPVFMFVFDELWAYVAQYIQPLMSHVLGPSCL